MTHWAILVGVNHYGPNFPNDELRSCVADVKAIEEFLVNRPTDYEIATLTSTKPTNPSKSQPPEEPSTRATIKNFLCQLKFIEAHGQQGDNVYIHYSGHGSNREGDVKLTFYNENQGKDYYWGERLASRLKRLVEKRKMLVTVVFDCCFSAATKRHGRPGAAEVRYREYDPLVDTHESQSNPDDSIDGAVVVPMRNAKAVPQWLIDPNGYTIFCACTSEQTAESVVFKVDRELGAARGTTSAEPPEATTEETTEMVEEYRGALSYVLLEALKQIASTGTAVHDHILHRHMCAIFHAKIPTQNPTRYGNKQSSFFADIDSALDNKITSVTKVGDQLILKNGSAHGVVEGDEYELFLLDNVTKISKRVTQERETRYSEKPTAQESDSISIDRLIARVGNVRGLTADLTTIEDGESIDRADNGWMARPLSQLHPQGFPVRLELPDRVREEWSQEAIGRELLRLCEQTSSASPCLFTVILNARQEYEISDASLHRMQTLPVIPSVQQNAKHMLLDVLEHITTYKYVENITNRLPDRTLANSFTVELRKKDGSTTGSSGILKVQEDEPFSFEFSNLGETILYVYLYILNPDWSIQDGNTALGAGERAEVSPGSTPKNEYGGELTGGIPHFCKDHGVRQIDEVFKFFVTRTPDSFAPLRMPALSSGSSRGTHNHFRRWLSARKDSCRGPPETVREEEWMSVNLIVQTTSSET
jgi:hypothetical protein